MRAVILAGGWLTAGGEKREKALLDLANSPMIAYVIQALSGVEMIEEILVIGPEKMANGGKAKGIPLKLLPAREALIDNVILAVGQAPPDEALLLATCDIPFLTAEAVHDFLRRCFAMEEADFYYPIIRKEVVQAQFPGMKRTYVKLREGAFTGGNLFLVRPAAILRVARRAEEFLQKRKIPWRLSAELGWSFTARLLLSPIYGFLRLDQVEKRFEELLGVRAKAVITPYPQIGADIDKPSDWLAAQRIIRESLASNTKEMI